jgi:hypothetical protein
MRAVEFRRPGSSISSILLQNNLKPALFAEFVLPSIHLSSTDKACTGRFHSFLNIIFNFFFRASHSFHVDIPDHGQLMFVLGSVILYPQSRVELSVLRQQMIESGGKKILLNAVDAGSEDAETIFYQSLDKTLDNLRKVFH